jgi:hypothetical protein
MDIGNKVTDSAHVQFGIPLQVLYQIKCYQLSQGAVYLNNGRFNDRLMAAGGLNQATATDSEFSKAGSRAKNRADGLFVLLRSDKLRYGKLVEEFVNNYNKGHTVIHLALSKISSLCFMKYIVGPAKLPCMKTLG